MDWHNLVTTDLSVCHGKACVKGTRIMVSVVLDNLFDGASVEEIIASYPSLNRDVIHACIATRTMSTSESTVYGSK